MMMMSLLQAMAATASGLDTHAARIRIHASNMANLGTPGYVRQIPVLGETAKLPFSAVMGLAQKQGANATLGQGDGVGVQLLGTVDDPTPGKKLYMPNHPEADKEGYVTMSNTNPLGDMADALVANRMYEANLSMYGILKSMASRAIELGSGR
jgi:flagellar basal-body rod protein FlgC